MSCFVHLRRSSFGDAIMPCMLHVIQKVLDGIIKQGEATEILPLSSRQNRGDKGKIRGKVIKRHRWAYQDFSPTWPLQNRWRGTGSGSMMRPYGWCSLTQEIGRRPGSIETTLHGATGAALRKQSADAWSLSRLV